MKSLQARLPILLSVAFVTAIVLFAAHKLYAWSDAAVAGVCAGVVAFYLGWLFLEANVAKRELDKGTTSLDRGTLELYAAGRALTVLVALALAEPPTMTRATLGAVVLVSAVFFRLSAIRELGRFYSHRVRVTGDHAIVDSGPYRVLRHPAYTGMLVAHAGFVLVFFHWAALLALLVVLLPAIVLRIRVEERALMELAGYAEFSVKRRRLVPLVW